MAKYMFAVLIFPAFLMDSGSAEEVTLSELWKDTPCNKEITLSEAKNEIQLRAQSFRITQVTCRDENNVSLNLTTQVNLPDTLYTITSPEIGTWNCSFRAQDHAETAYCVIHIKDFSSSLRHESIWSSVHNGFALSAGKHRIINIDAFYCSQVHEILSWCSLLAAVGTAVMIIVLIIIYYKRKVRRCESNAIYEHVEDRAPMELPSEITYDYAYSHRISLNLKEHSTEERDDCNRKPNMKTAVNLKGNPFKADYVPHNNVFV